MSPQVLAVGGTRLALNAAGNWGDETGWGGSGGGFSIYESKPQFQAGVNPFATRSTPDVSYNGDPASGIAVYTTSASGGPGWYRVGGTSAGAPQWAGLLADVDEMRGLMRGLGSLESVQATLYGLPWADFHDVTAGVTRAGNTTYYAGPGYDQITGRGSPVANMLVPDLVNAASGGKSASGSKSSGGTKGSPPPPMKGKTGGVVSLTDSTLPAAAASLARARPAMITLSPPALPPQPSNASSSATVQFVTPLTATVTALPSAGSSAVAMREDAWFMPPYPEKRPSTSANLAPKAPAQEESAGVDDNAGLEAALVPQACDSFFAADDALPENLNHGEVTRAEGDTNATFGALTVLLVLGPTALKRAPHDEEDLPMVHRCSIC